MARQELSSDNAIALSEMKDLFNDTVDAYTAMTGIAPTPTQMLIMAQNLAVNAVVTVNLNASFSLINLSSIFPTAP